MFTGVIVLFQAVRECPIERPHASGAHFKGDKSYCIIAEVKFHHVALNCDSF